MKDHIFLYFIFFSLYIYPFDLEFSMYILKVPVEGSMSQILYLGPIFYFMTKDFPASIYHEHMFKI